MVLAGIKKGVNDLTIFCALGDRTAAWQDLYSVVDAETAMVPAMANVQLQPDTSLLMPVSLPQAAGRPARARKRSILEGGSRAHGSGAHPQQVRAGPRPAPVQCALRESQELLDRPRCM